MAALKGLVWWVEAASLVNLGFTTMQQMILSAKNAQLAKTQSTWTQLPVVSKSM